MPLDNEIRDLQQIEDMEGDWEGWYLDDKLIAQGHRVLANDLLEKLQNTKFNLLPLIEVDMEAIKMSQLPKSLAKLRRLL